MLDEDQKKQAFGLILALVLAVAVAGTFEYLRYTNNVYIGSRYRLTADVEESGKDVVASNVYAYNCGSPHIQQSASTSGYCELNGEALILDLGERGKLFILMNDWNTDHSGLAGHNDLVHRLALDLGQNRPVSQSDMPAMVRFRDINDPASVEVVNPEHLEQSFGPGVTLKSLTLTTPRNWDSPQLIATNLPWLAHLRGDVLGQDPAKNPLAAKLHSSDFKWPPK